MKTTIKKISLQIGGLKDVLLKIAVVVTLLGVDNAYAQQKTIGDIGTQITTSFAGLAKLVTAGAYIAGMGFALTSILKFKQHKDNPTNIPIGTPIALLFIGGALLFLPNLFGIAGQTIFGTTAGAGGISGVTSF